MLRIVSFIVLLCITNLALSDTAIKKEAETVKKGGKAGASLVKEGGGKLKKDLSGKKKDSDKDINVDVEDSNDADDTPRKQE